MPLQINNVLEELDTFTWHYLGEDIEITYNQMAYTPAFEEELFAIADKEKYAAGLGAAVAQTVTAWEMEWDGEVVPLDAKNDVFKKIPFKILYDLMQAIGEHNAPGADEGKGSGGGSLSAVNRQTRRQRGTRSSKPRSISG